MRYAEHLAAVEIMQLKHIIILQNKIDLINESVAQNQHEAIQVRSWALRLGLEFNRILNGHCLHPNED